MTSRDADFRIATHWLEKAFEAEASAHLEFDAGHFGFVAGRLEMVKSFLEHFRKFVQ